jgi:hypothetical protein
MKASLPRISRKLKRRPRKSFQSILKSRTLNNTTLELLDQNMQIYSDSKEELMRRNSQEEEEEAEEEASEVETEVASEVEIEAKEVVTEVETEVATEVETEVATEVATEVEEAKRWSLMKKLSQPSEELLL